MNDATNNMPLDDTGSPDWKNNGGFLIVALGASAGGIKAFKDFFARVPADSGMAYVVILHLSPDYDSKLAEILQLTATIPVTQVTEQVKIEPNHVYVIPPNQSLSVADEHLTVSEIMTVEERCAPVDIFLRTLAQTYGTRAISVILSGTGANGSMGLKRVKEMGGIAIVQDPKEAEYGDMPRNSIATGLVDYVLPVKDIPPKLIAYKKHINSINIQTEALGRPENDEQAIRDIFTQLRIRTGHDFSNYKRATVLRRIERRINVHELPDLPAYARFMRDHPNEAQSLLKDLLISVTNFFRDKEAFQALERDFIPKLFDEKGAGDQVRVWVAGCASGEEAYSIAMLLAEYKKMSINAPTIQVFATDIDEASIAGARDGFYTDTEVADVSPERLRRFFIKESEGYRVRRELRELVLFAAHNLIKDPPFSHLDLLSCRNLLIYFNRTAQERAMEVMHFALKPGAHLFLGLSESINGSADLFVARDKDHHIFQSRALTARPIRAIANFSITNTKTPLTEHNLQSREEERAQETRALERLTYLDLHQRLLEQYSPPSVVVNEDYDIVHLSERAGRYMQIMAGEPSHNLLRLVRSELRLELRTALYQSVQNRTNVEARGLQLRIDDYTETINLIVRPVLREDDPTRGFILVLFEQEASKKEISENLVTTELVSSIEPAAKQLEAELIRIKARLRSTIEQYEVQHEELKASNEELQAMNEELRSAAEELETSKEELQSLNEELTTVNQELKVKIEELSQANNDFQNLMASTEIGTIFLDRSLRVKLFTPRAKDIFNFIPTDVSRPFLDITNKLIYDDLLADVENVLERLHIIEREVETRDGKWYQMRFLPYRTAEDRINGVVITFVDISENKRVGKIIRESEDRLRRAIQIETVGIIFFKTNGQITDANDAFLRMSGYTREEVEAGLARWDQMTPPEWMPHSLKAIEEFESSGRVTPYEKEYIRKDGSRWWALFAATRLNNVEGVEYIIDITESKQTEIAFRLSQERLRLVVESITDYAILTLTDGGRINSWNPGAELIFGYKDSEILGESTAILFTPEDRERSVPEEEMNRALAEGRAADERWHIRRDGTRFFASGVMVPLQDGDAHGFAKIARDLTESKKAEDHMQQTRDALEVRVKERTEELFKSNSTLQTEVIERASAERRIRELLKQLIAAQENERKRISRDLHDQMGQQLTVLRLKLDSIKEDCKDQIELCNEVDQIQAIARQIDSEVDFLAWELRPASLDEFGLVPALANFVQEWSKHFKIPVQFHTTEPENKRLAPEVETNLYRIAQEALNNVYKHSGATRVDIILEQRNNHLLLIVEDNGKGFDLNEQTNSGAGLINMRERASFVGGTIEIESTQGGKGTTVYVRVPISQ